MKPVIVGIDPGTTTGIAVLDLFGNLLKIYSGKELGISELINKVYDKGLPVLVGTDKEKVPSLIEEFSRKTGAKIVSPNADMQVDAKKSLVEGMDYKGSHEMDSLAAAIFAYNSVKPTVQKIISEKAQGSDEALILVLRDDVPIKLASALLERKDEVKEEIEKIVYNREIKRGDYLKLLESLRMQKKDNLLLKEYAAELRKELAMAVANFEKISRKRTSLDSEKINGLFQVKEKRLLQLETQVLAKNEEISSLKAHIGECKKCISGISGKYVLKKVENLAKPAIEIFDNDILFVNNPNVYNDDFIAKIKDKVKIIVYKIKPVLRAKELGFRFVSSEGLEMAEFGGFFFVSKSELDKRIQMKEDLRDLIKSYQKDRSVN